MKKYFNVVKRAYLWLFIALGMVVTSWIVFSFTAHFSEEFTGGIKVVFNGKVEEQTFKESLQNYLEEQGFQNLKINLEQHAGDVEVKINTKRQTDTQVNQLAQLIPVYLQVEHYISSQTEIVEHTVIGPSVGAYMQSTATKALAFGIIAMVIYMIFSFGTIRKHIAPAILACVVILSTVISVSIPAWAYGLWMAVNPTIQIDTVFIIAILTIIGYGINDVIIIFDRVRENMIRYGDKRDMHLDTIFEESIWQSMKRSLGTSVSTLLVLLGMFVFATGVVSTFAFTVGVGVVASTLSSIFIAVPAAYLLVKLSTKKK